jgi:hypothetical protein
MSNSGFGFLQLCLGGGAELPHAGPYGRMLGDLEDKEGSLF